MRLNLATVLFAFTASVALAGPVTWNVNASFTDGGTLTGSFVFDASTNSVSTWNLTVSGGNTIQFPDYTYTTDAVPVYYSGFFYPEIQLVFHIPATPRLLVLSTVAPLTDAGGTVNLIGFVDVANFSGECHNCDPYRVLAEGGTLAASESSAVPEPTPWSMMTLAGVLGGSSTLLRKLRSTGSGQ